MADKELGDFDDYIEPVIDLYFSFTRNSLATKKIISFALAKFFQRTLDKYGYSDLETLMDEWNGPHADIQHGTSYAASQVAAMMCAMHSTTTDMLCFYDYNYFSRTFKKNFGVTPAQYKKQLYNPV